MIITEVFRAQDDVSKSQSCILANHTSGPTGTKNVKNNQTKKFMLKGGDPTAVILTIDHSIFLK